VSLSLVCLPAGMNIDNLTPVLSWEPIGPGLVSVAKDRGPSIVRRELKSLFGDLPLSRARGRGSEKRASEVRRSPDHCGCAIVSVPSARGPERSSCRVARAFAPSARSWPKLRQKVHDRSTNTLWP